MSRINVRIAVLALALLPVVALFAARPLMVGISESFLSGEKSAKVMVNASYADAVARSGHVPVVIPRFGSDEQIDVLVSKLDVLILTGGEDVDPARYKASKSPKLGQVNAPRDEFDFR
ncbi:MAG: gamma-glutamyl-gamma-aminobutyrate hydrolase family protein, partial [Kiritimatiellae bacterium]|nr:gamma-glutamyl-gamma-aminobutyrate hydrolase family protein [Kiritimatiellia bacterium]